MSLDQKGRPAVTPEEQEQLLESPDARSERLAEYLGSLKPPTEPLQGKTRETLFDSEMPAPDEIPEVGIIELGRALAERPDPILNKFTRYSTPKPAHDWQAIERYIVFAGSKQERRKLAQTIDQPQLDTMNQEGATEEQKQQKKFALRRRPHNIADKVQRGFRVGVQLARLRRAALSSVQRSVREGTPLNPTAANWAADAIEEFGFSLRDTIEAESSSDFGSRLRAHDSVAADLEAIGVYSSKNPELLRRQPNVLRLVQIEQAKRVDFWGGYLDVMLAHDRDRSTRAEKEASESIEQMITELQT